MNDSEMNEVGKIIRIAMQNNEKCCRCEFENMCFFAYVCLSDNYSFFYFEKENLLND